MISVLREKLRRHEVLLLINNQTVFCSEDADRVCPENVNLNMGVIKVICKEIVSLIEQKEQSYCVS